MATSLKNMSMKDTGVQDCTVHYQPQLDLTISRTINDSWVSMDGLASFASVGGNMKENMFKNERKLELTNFSMIGGQTKWPSEEPLEEKLGNK